MAALITANGAYAQTATASQTRDFLSTLRQCRLIQDPDARLSCFDQTASVLAEAEDIAVVSREDVARNQRAAFGFNARLINPFSRDGRSEDLQSIDATLVSVRDLGRGEMILTLDDGSVWRKTDSAATSFSTRRQYPVVVRRAALGSYMMKVDDNPPFRVRRE